MAWQKTIRRTVRTEGVGIHRGEHTKLELRPAPAGTGIVFVRKDLGVSIPARAENTRDLAYATTLAVRGAEVGTIEHLMALKRAGVEEQRVSLPEVRLTEVVRVGDAERWVELHPARELLVDYSVRYDSVAVGQQQFLAPITPARFASAIAPARTFGFLNEVAALRSRGLARGGTLDNCVVVDGERILSGSLRFRDEFVRHKVLDLLGDLALLEYPLRARVVARKAGHALHVKVVQELLAHPEVWELVEPDRVAPFTVHPYAGELQTQVALAG